jgi:hypothetical protein
MDLAISMGRSPGATDCLLPSGRVISMLLIGNSQCSVAELDAGVTAVTEGLVRGDAAAAEGHAVALFVVRAIFGLDGNAAAHPEGAAATEGGIFDHSDGGRKRLLDLFVGLLVMDHQAASGAVIGFADDQVAGSRVFGLFDEGPDFAGRVAEAGEGAETLVVAQRELRAVESLGLMSEGGAAGGFPTVEAGLRMAAVAEGLVLRVSAPAERVGRFDLERSALDPIPGKPFLIGSDDLDGERHVPRHEVGTVLCDDYFGIGGRSFGHGFDNITGERRPDQGVGRGRGRPPHYALRARFMRSMASSISAVLL